LVKNPDSSKNIFAVFQIVSWIIMLALTGYILFCYLTGKLTSSEQAILTIIILFTVIATLLTTRSLPRTLLVTTIVAHLGLLILWGNIVPFVPLIPLFISYQLILIHRDALAKYYLWFSLIFNIAEIIGLLPLSPHILIEIGSANLIVNTLLQSIAYYIWSYLLRLYTLISKFDFFGLGNTGSLSSTGFLRSTLAKGLFMSLLLHYLNNLMNGAIWNTTADSRKLEILRLLGESERSDAGSGYTVGKVVEMAGINAKPSIGTLDTKKLRLHQAKVLFLLLANVEDNYRKYTTEHTCKVTEEENGRFAFTFVGKPEPEFRYVKGEKLWGRNLGTMRQYVELVGIGSLDIHRATAAYITILTFSFSSAK